MDRRMLVIGMVTALAIALSGPAVGAAQAESASAVRPQAKDGTALSPDYNGDGFADLAVGVLSEDVVAAADAGAVNVLYGSPAGPVAAGDQFWTQDSPGIMDMAETGDSFGSALAWGDFNSDTFADLAIGAYLEDVGAASDAGSVSVIYGSAAGLSPVGNQFWTQDTPGILDVAEAGDLFGLRLAAGDYNGDGFGDLAVSASSEDAAAVADVGAVNVLYGSAAGLAAAGNQLWSQNSPGIVDVAEAGDGFSAGIAAGDINGDGFSDLSVGVNLEDVGAIADAGATNVIYGSPAGLAPAGNQFLSQDTPGINDVAESGDGFGFPPAAGDFNGDGFADLAVGVIAEDFGAFTDPGALNVIYGSATGLSAAGNQLWQQNSPGVIDAVEDFDNFGRPRVGDFNGDGFVDVGVGVIGEDVGAVVDCGAANVLYGSAAGLSAVGNQFISQDTPGVLDVAETGDSFGADRSAADFNGDGFADLGLGAYLEDVGAVADAGAVNLLFGSAAGLSAAGNQFWNQDAPGVLDVAETGDLFGFGGATGEVLTEK